MSQIVAAAVYHKGRKVTDIHLDEGRHWAEQPDHMVWIGLRDPDSSLLQTLQQQFNLHELAMEDAIDRHTRPKLETFGDALFMVVYTPIREDGRLLFMETQLFAGKGYVISARYGHSTGYSAVRQSCEARPLLLEHGEDFVLYALLNFITESYRPQLDSMFDELEELEQRVLKRPLTQRDVERVSSLRRELLRLRRYTGPLGEICHELQKLEFPFIDKHMRPYFRDLEIHVRRLQEDLSGMRDMADHAIEIGLLLESSRQSIVQRKFAAWAAILALPTAIAGVYGMNFENMPELRWEYGYFLVLTLLISACAALYFNFKRMNWL